MLSIFIFLFFYFLEKFTTTILFLSPEQVTTLLLKFGTIHNLFKLFVDIECFLLQLLM